MGIHFHRFGKNVGLKFSKNGLNEFLSFKSYTIGVEKRVATPVHLSLQDTVQICCTIICEIVF